ncbi:Na+/H+ antiporter subunit E [Cytobacillus firmus]|uniref:Na+/H+ antiporter subunit E n=1 Tax=Cytobacillus firmus TaxID=1399 RepID=UPI0021898309|nr:Na+/H+ antiporter subunit E [Cytobacillus firmus]URM33975.1 Na+/H+ antiporter subunit E [Cytobacillus firmus]
MPIQVLINLFIAFLWMFLQDDWSVLSFFSGYLVGIIVLIVLEKFFKAPLYLRSLVAILKLFFVFIWELFTSSILVIRQVIRPRINITPGIFTIETELEGELEVTLLALLLSLTPGSVVVEISHDNKVFYIHAMDIPESSESVIVSKDRFEKAIKKVTRK